MRGLGSLTAALLLAAAPAVPAAAHAPPLAQRRGGSAVAALIDSWSGVYDDLEQVIFDAHARSPLVSDDERRIRTIVAPVSLPWLARRVLYLEEFRADDPGEPRRQVLLWLAPQPGAIAGLVRVRQLTFREPQRWRHLFERPRLASQLRWRDLASMPGCDLIMTESGSEFVGGTVGRRCVDSLTHPHRFVTYRLLVGDGLNWYRKRIFRRADDRLETETVGFERFEPHQARLYACRIRWSRSGRPADLAPLATLDLQDEGGRAVVATPDGHSFEIELHSGDWPFDANRDALILIVRQLGSGAPLVSSWAGLDAEQISAAVGGVDVSCGPIAPRPRVRS